MFSQRHYQSIADWLKSIKPEPENYEALKQWNITVENFVYEFASDNPRFKPDLFKRAASYGA
jgi:hypothetical protein